jgi:hypothetical protein
MPAEITPARMPDGTPPRAWPTWMLRAVGLTGFATVLSLALVACGTGGTVAPTDFGELPGTIELNQGQVTNDVPLGGAGTGTVDVAGKVYHFAIGGVGVDGAALSVIQTVGEAYRLRGSISGFPGTYRRAPSGSVIPGKPSGGLWLQNERGTLIHLLVPPGGRMPNIGDDGVLIVLQQ